ncbi:MAG: DUF192 domain-containing protein [Coriobacteriales bacterium]
MDNREAVRVQGNVRTRWATSFAQRLRGLIGRCPEWLGDGGVLVIAPCSDIHTFGMRRDLDVAFLDASGKVLASYVAVGPHRRIRCTGAVAVLERFSLGNGRGGACCLSWARDAWYRKGDYVVLGDRCALDAARRV